MQGSLESLGRLRLQAVILLLVVFVIGALTGAAIERTRRPRPPGPPPREGLSPAMRDELRLTAAQNQRVDAILAGSRRRTDVVLDRFLPQLRALTDSIRTEVRAVLTPEQQEIFDRLEPPLMQPPPRRPPDGGEFRGGPPPDGPPPGH